MKRSSKQSLLWKLFLPGKENQASLLFGSMHQFPGRDWPRREQLFAALTDRSLYWLATETALDEEHSLDPASLARQTNQNWTSLLPPHHLQKIRKLLLKSIGLDILPFGSLPPLLLLQQIQQAWLAPYGKLQMMDLELWNLAQKNGLACLGLESFEEHYGLLNTISTEEQVKLLLHSMRNIRRSRKKLLHLYQLYSQEKTSLLYKLSKQGMGKLRHSMLYQRNQLMARRIARQAEQSPGLAIVGAAHLSGGKGLLRQLKTQGFVVKPIQPHQPNDPTTPQKRKAEDPNR